MISHSGLTTSLWMTDRNVPAFPSLRESTTADVCVVGAGIAGLTTAYQLAASGKSVVVLEAGGIGTGETERTTAHLSNALDDHYQELERLHGEKGAKLAAQSHAMAISEIERIVNAEQIPCDFMRLDGYLFPAPGEKEDFLVNELAAAQRAGVRGASLVSETPYIGGPAIRFPQQGQFHPLKYLTGLALAIEWAGGRLYTDTRAVEITGGRQARVTTERGPHVTCSAIVVATNSPVNDRFAIHTKQAPYRTYVVGLAVPRASVPRALYWDTADPYHYVRLQPSEHSPAEDILIVGGEDHKTGQADEQDRRFAALETWTREHFPAAGEVRYRWSGQVLEPIDGMAYIGRNPGDDDNVYIATGDSGHGMTHGTIAGMLLSDLIQGRSNDWAELYDPSRITLSASAEFVKENLNVAAQYVDWVTGGEEERTSQLAPGEGSVVRHGLHKVAVYRDDTGELHECSAVCPHLGGIVSWNKLEQSFDCPCHGSRFDRYGKVLNGPAKENLAPLGESAETASTGSQEHGGR